MKERPILFNDEMVRAILEGRKTQTRRIMKPQPEQGLEFTPFAPFGVVNGKGDRLICRHGKPGDRLWVRETTKEDVPGSVSLAIYDADYAHVMRKPGDHAEWWYSRPVCPSIHMPRWASRITLEITDVRVERLQDISEEDAKAEGAQHFPDLPGRSPYGQDGRWSMEQPTSVDQCLSSPRWAFANYFCKIAGKAPTGIHDPEPWDVNPWVWVIEFRRVD